MLPMRFECLRPREVPHLTRIAGAYLSDFSQVAGYYEHPPTLDGVRAAAASVPSGRREELIVALRALNQLLGPEGHLDASVGRALDRLATGAVAVVAGQQTGLFTGPAYTLYKALTAIHVAKELTAAGTDAVPVFWLASEDHDLAEVDHADWLTRQGLEHIELPRETSTDGHRVGEIALGHDVARAVACASNSLDGPGAEAIGSALASSYTPAETYSSAFGKLFARLFQGRGLILFDPLDPGLAALAVPVLQKALRETAVLVADLISRSKALEHAGYHAQVKVTESATLLFAMLDGRRLPLRVRNSGLAAGPRHFPLGELLALEERSPGALSPSALLRPVVQDSLLPTAAVITGPAEMAYFAQSHVLYRRLLGRMPAVLPREGFTLVEPHVARMLKKYKLDLPDVLRGSQHLRRRLERESVPRALARQMTLGDRNLRRYLERIRKPLRKLDPTLTGALDTAQRKMLYQLDKLRTRAGRAADHREELLDRHERILREALAPHHDLQERTLCALPLLARQGLELLDALEERSHGFVGAGGACHHIAFL